VLERLGVGEKDSQELFAVMDTNSDGGVSLTEFLHALVDVSPEALLWELRCRLIRVGISAQNLRKALELVRWPQHGWQSKATELKRRKTRRIRRCSACASCSGCSCAEGKTDGSVTEASEVIEAPMEVFFEIGPKPRPPSSYHLSRGDWLKLCTSICLTLLEAERLFEHLVDKSGMVDLRAMFETLRTTVEPDVSLERFTTKVQARYETVQAAFAAFCEDRDTDPERMLRWDGFHALAVSLNVNDTNAEKLWDVLTACTWDQENSPERNGNGQRTPKACITESAFVGQLSLWAPETALQALEGEMCERFGNLAEGQRALEKHLTKTDALSPRELDSRLRAVGIKNCDVQRALRTVASRRNDTSAPVSLDATISTMRATRRSASKAGEPSRCARNAIKHDTLPLWEQLRNVQHDLRKRVDDDLCTPKAREPVVTFQEHVQRSPSPAGPAERRRFAEAVHGAVRSAETSRSRFVLQSAHRQVVRLEERWAASPGPDAASPPGGSGGGLALPSAALGCGPHRGSGNSSRRSSVGGGLRPTNSEPSLPRPRTPMSPESYAVQVR